MLIIERIEIKNLALDPNNARKHSERNLKAIAVSLEKFGQRKPIVIHDTTVIAGNGTVEAAKTLGWTHIEASRVPSEWTVDEAKAYALADNRSAELAEWDEPVLAGQLLELDASGWDLSALGFDAPNAEDEPDLTDDEIPEPPKEPVTKLGDVWQVGPHRVMCADSTDTSLYPKLFATQPDAIVTDPPYGISANTMTLGNGKKKFHRGEGWDNAPPPLQWLIEMDKTTIIWGGNYFADQLPATNDWLCWHKKISNVSFSEFELAWTNLGKNCRIISHHWSGEEKQHVTMKPLPVMIWCLDYLPAGATVFDPFAGSGSTLVAAARTRRIGYGIELDPTYVDVILKRLENETGLTAELLSETHE